MPISKILITGGTSFVGYWLRVTKPVDTMVYSIGRDKYESMEWKKTKWDAIIHAALVAPTEVLKQDCRVLYVSSGVIYHPEYEPKYRKIKIDGEQECLNSGADFVIARLFTFCGERLDNNKAISTFYKAATENKPLVITGDGSTVRSYMHGSLMADWMWKILKNGERRRSYDVGSDEPVSMLELTQRIITETNSSSRIVLLNGRDPMPYYMPPDTAKTKALLNL